MFASATDGGSPNNDMFSTCSRNSIGPLIQSRGQSAGEVASFSSFIGDTAKPVAVISNFEMDRPNY